MKTTDYLDEIAKMYPGADGNPATDYRVGKLLELKSTSAMSKYRLHGTTFDDKTAVKAAELLGMDADIVIIDMNCERARKQADPNVQRVWDGIAKKLSGTAAGLMLATALSVPGQSEAKQQFNITNITASNLTIIYIMPLLFIAQAWGFIAHLIPEKIKGFLNPVDTDYPPSTTPVYA